MTVEGALTILMYALAPFTWLLMAGLVVIVTIQLLAHLRGYRLLGYHSLPAGLAAIAIGLSGLWWIPPFTHSRLAYVTSVFDWVAMAGAVVGLALVAWLLLHPLSYLLQPRSQPRQGGAGRRWAGP